MMSIPTLLMGLLIVAILGPSQTNLIIALALTMVPRFARIARAPTIAAKNKPMWRRAGPWAFPICAFWWCTSSPISWES